MGASPKTKADYLRQIEILTSDIASYQMNIANAKAKLAQPAYSRMHSSYKSDIANWKAQIARRKGEISVLKMKMKDAPKG